MTAEEIAKQLVETLEYVQGVVNNVESPWWMDCPDKGGFDMDKINESIKNGKLLVESFNFKE